MRLGNTWEDIDMTDSIKYLNSYKQIFGILFFNKILNEILLLINMINKYKGCGNNNISKMEICDNS